MDNITKISKIIESNVLLVAVILLLVIKVITVFAPINFPKNIFFADITKSALESFVNQSRQSAGLNPLSENEKLNQAANLKAQNMVQDQYFDHTSPSGVSPWYWFSMAGYKYKYAGENLAVGFFDSYEVYQAWLNSPSHRANILNPNYTEIGTAIVHGFGLNESIIVVQTFASPAYPNTAPTQTIPETGTQVIEQTPASATVLPQETEEDNVLPQEQVLSQTEENYLKSSTDKTTTGFISRTISNAIYGFEDVLQNVIFGFTLFVTGIMIAIVLFSLDIKIKKPLMVRAVVLLILLVSATLISRELVISLIPHQIII